MTVRGSLEMVEHLVSSPPVSRIYDLSMGKWHNSLGHRRVSGAGSEAELQSLESLATTLQGSLGPMRDLSCLIDALCSW